MRNKRGKKGQIEISFGMIFSIILIIAFIVVAVYAIILFMKTKDCTEIGLFKNDLQEAVNSAWNGEYTDTSLKRSLPEGIDFVCIVDSENQTKGNYAGYLKNVSNFGSKGFNIFFWPIKKACKGEGTFKLEHINLAAITKDKNPYCIQNRDGVTNIKIEKSFNDRLVKLSEI